MNNEIEKTISEFEYLKSVIETYKNVVDIVGKKALGMSDETLRSLGRASVNTAKGNLEGL
jgi:hypothetical protein